jgi:hypothetical protein
MTSRTEAGIGQLLLAQTGAERLGAINVRRAEPVPPGSSIEWLTWAIGSRLDAGWLACRVPLEIHI